MTNPRDKDTHSLNIGARLDDRQRLALGSVGEDQGSSLMRQK